MKIAVLAAMLLMGGCEGYETLESQGISCEIEADKISFFYWVDANDTAANVFAEARIDTDWVARTGASYNISDSDGFEYGGVSLVAAGRKYTLSMYRPERWLAVSRSATAHDTLPPGSWTQICP